MVQTEVIENWEKVAPGAEKALGNVGTISFTLTASWTFPSPEEPALLLVADTKRGLSESSQGASVNARFRVTEIQQPVDPKEYEAAPFTSMSKQQSLRIDWETMAIPAPDVSDRSTLLNLARASWDAYHPMPEASAKWYPLEGFNCCSIDKWNPGDVLLRLRLEVIAQESPVEPNRHQPQLNGFKVDIGRVRSSEAPTECQR
ncbi:hypothetical protein BS47DRAFT_36433 [Hydnum rufescens UP504]|uniref:Uncharacterized protein n=1 Tax=Hydnum rufescens UP504 TaxID=1448309 RepID=A0A9P6ASH4_9AGAM|nr:hypothetical protein BS47DRAFT_36433 [Hydnum rufescens UP504]